MIVEQFIKWIGTAPADSRARATHALARVYLLSDVSDSERADAEAAMTFLLDDPALSVRSALADVLHDKADAPRHIILALIDDDPSIACTILRHSPLVIDNELVDYVASGNTLFQLAIAGRKPLSHVVTKQIAEIASPNVVEVLLNNDEADIGETVLMQICSRLGAHPTVQQQLLAREDLPIAARQMIIVSLSDALSASAVQNEYMDQSRLESVSRDARDRATLKLVAHADRFELPALVRHLQQTDQLTTALLLRAMCAGEFDFFAATMTELSELKAERVNAIMSEGSARAFRALYDKADLPQSAFPAFAIALSVYRDENIRNEQAELQHDPYRFTRVLIERILELYREEATTELDKVLILLRRFASETARDAARDFVQLRLAAA